MVCFLSATVTPMPWNLALFIAAAVLPTFAVMLANAIDQRASVENTDAELPSQKELPGTITVDGEVEEDQ